MDNRTLKEQLRLKAELALKKRREITSQQETRLAMIKADLVEVLADEMRKDVIAKLRDYPSEKLAFAALICDYDEYLSGCQHLREVVKSFKPRLNYNPMMLLPDLMRFIARKLNELLYRSLDGTKIQHSVEVFGDDIVTPIRKRIVVTIRV